MINNKYIIDTAHYNNYAIAKEAAEKAGLQIRTDYRANCFKSYHIELTATDIDQDYILNLIALATFAAPGQDQHKAKLSNYIHSTGSVQDFIESIA
jgi:hypothetical protein